MILAYFIGSYLVAICCAYRQLKDPSFHEAILYLGIAMEIVLAPVWIPFAIFIVCYMAMLTTLFRSLDLIFDEG